MIGRGEGYIILEEVGEFLHKGRGKLQSSIGDYFRVEAELRKNIGEEKLGNSFGINVFCAGGVNYPLRKAMVYHNHYCVISVGIGESSDKIYRYGGKRERVFDGQRGKSGYGGMGVHLGGLAIGASHDELSEEGRHPRPPVVSLHAMEGLEELLVTSGGGVKERFYQVMAHRFRDVEAMFEI